jgi:hypothetical protein
MKRDDVKRTLGAAHAYIMDEYLGKTWIVLKDGIVFYNINQILRTNLQNKVI